MHEIELKKEKLPPDTTIIGKVANITLSGLGGSPHLFTFSANLIVGTKDEEGKFIEITNLRAGPFLLKESGIDIHDDIETLIEKLLPIVKAHYGVEE